MESIPLYPPLFKAGKSREFVESGRTVASCLSPRDLSAAVFATNTIDPQVLRASKKQYPKAQSVYTACFERLPTPERRSFVTDTSVVFAALQNLRLPEAADDSSLTSDEKYKALVKLAMDYVTLAKDAWVQTSDAGPGNAYDHYRVIYSCLSLFVVLYMPESGLDYAPVGEELMEWLNVNFIAPTSEEGDHLSSQECPWEDYSFWPYLTRTVLRGLLKSSEFFVTALSRHPSEYLSSISETLCPLLSGQPRLVHFKTERDFVVAQRRWKERVKSLRLELDRIPDHARQDGTGDWWTPLSNIIGILEGRGDVIKDVCANLEGDWKEVCAAWGVFVDHRLLRQDLPEVVKQILDEMPPDPTDLEDNILASLFSGKPAIAVGQAAKHDLWLSAHWADLMESLELLDASALDELGLTSRRQYVLAYADYLRSDTALWRIAVAYLGACGDIGLQRMDEVLLHVPVVPRDAKAIAVDRSSTDEGNVVAAVPPILKEVVQTCFEYGREHVRRTVCSVCMQSHLLFSAPTSWKIAAQAFLQRKHYGLAISYLTSAEDWTALGHVIDNMLNEFIQHGAERFTRLVATVAPSLQELQAHPDATGVFIRRLLFAVRYAEFHQRRLSGDLQDAALDLEALFDSDIAPRAWWGVLLQFLYSLLLHSLVTERHLFSDGVLLFSSRGAVQLLHRLQEVYTAVDQCSGDDYLDALRRTMKGASTKEATNRLRRTSLALAKYYAACTVMADTV
ncbi:Nup85 nucleoporin-domain-containing protein [Vararia minispora EC-137]|uniref:Nup85 nucleoporin-domain-containing protein n=1 Tax=Vararia minispora EC-137 TaxID=1314806 RepID=A0ACB8Q9F5_9AGAM|nr:Nup85 nucleoporin-domain-containing protein [Vararia minispora EC-137]